MGLMRRGSIIVLAAAGVAAGGALAAGPPLASAARAAAARPTISAAAAAPRWGAVRSIAGIAALEVGEGERSGVWGGPQRARRSSPACPR
jgi:hypothetical protein